MVDDCYNFVPNENSGLSEKKVWHFAGGYKPREARVYLRGANKNFFIVYVFGFLERFWRSRISFSVRWKYRAGGWRYSI